MRRGLLFGVAVLVATIVVAGPSAGAAVSTNTDYFQNARSYWGTCGATSCQYGSVNAQRRVNAATSGATVTPSATFQASGYTNTYVYSPCCSNSDVSYPLQTVSPTALNMDPIGNSASIAVTLTPTSGPPGTFNVSLSRPGYTSTYLGCLFPCVNPWVDAPSNTVHADHYQPVGLYRDNYEAAGTAADGFAINPTNSWAATYTQLSGAQAATLP